MAPAPIVLYQYGDNMFSHRWLDDANNVAFTISEASHNPTLVIKLHREAKWAGLHPTMLGPEKSWYYLGPGNKAGYVCYGNNQTNHNMSEKFRKKKREGSSSRYFTSQAGKEYKWKITETKMECFEGWTHLASTPIASYEISHHEAEYHGKVTLRGNAIALATEIMTSLVLNRMAADLGWD
ncbi:hypothetical protein AGABI1DRAFT_113076 [Agaricus bisporus var. burnettii JB137-S8]|uniref:DUF6593 domain-containing protein n=2 Tax=Agaricus bisporus var. burnettii TaxID=192524 RepID=K5X9S8_AGABU|nr:hypothetical protein AGABI2DRAFT_195868 [Agaricus bisporus var. bisporus H97]XP_007329129.1 uncharacterized protein AGABI1DRAFT_113076 [Agaricus bisporus var. burnettii JB137-S8]EKM79792.1 hypothetical protein AGABI1DRAFT_113076 [Agaricus bisporus var. burnettii JB137-S8]EKV42563.1 hypothetical protein AGABI2DRAFT_195868 [Agaricus bisporus var. bisporus H97]KAF7775655.1 hypothetical protein Agabi119p4_4048 [Agaricus bisporus var. burnettii]